MNMETINSMGVILCFLGGIIAFGGFISLSVDENQKETNAEDVFDYIIFGGVFTVIHNGSKNWSKMKEAKWLFLSGISMVLAGIFAWLL